MTDPRSDRISLWRELSLRVRKPAGRGHRGDDPGRKQAARFEASAKRRRSDEPDVLVDALADLLRPGDSLVDIGAGIGRWTVPLARLVKKVTALEPSPAMLARLRENASLLTNITVVESSWEDAEVGPHDVALCSHAMYSNPDLMAFVSKMERVARRLCALALRVPSHDGIIGELAQRVHGRWHDSPNFILAYNILLDAGICPNVSMEPEVRYWTDETFDGAMGRAKRHLRLGESTAYDDTIRSVLNQRLTARDGQWVWPDGMRSALVWWSPPRT
ncbi:MAG: class I SAM-dependent methyltransferase [Dehalococcoidia bacterium]|nr:class I SAM-dependent methyltransferase [Dehalococcoidia bacterium]MDP6228210.1 class I SAM-dependent methyltransferase [Dehalococcoidia bacterium]MDP7084518.1 class I SAM-dependent methyltransferase [Dehalococcoidia bacterium]MDP7200629.1 class I SAM-dependent methyltransferase [Dehalococcoidia bacterium]MDP7509896.1 class I SAM-dependent methyltransferase [Dehalococcoidia bacterium]